MARASDDDKDKALWLTLAQSWVRLADHVAYLTGEHDAELIDDDFVIDPAD